MLIDREQGGEAHLAKNGLALHAAFKLSAMLDVLTRNKLVTEEVAAKVRQQGGGGRGRRRGRGRGWSSRHDGS